MDNMGSSKTPKMRELTMEEIVHVNGGFLGFIIAAAAIILSGCVTMPHKGHNPNRDQNAPF